MRDGDGRSPSLRSSARLRSMSPAARARRAARRPALPADRARPHGRHVGHRACGCLMHQHAGPWIIAAASTVLIAGTGTGIRLAVTADPARRARARETAAAAAQYGLLFGFAAVAAAISAHGLVGFARSNMGLPGPLPYLLWGALDGAAGLCAVLLLRRAARGEPALAPRLAVWGLVAASGAFNWTHAPARPGAREAFALMPVIAAMLFEFSLRETRHISERTDRRLTGPGWLHPVERIKVQLQLAVNPAMPAEAATRRVRTDTAARRLHLLRQALGNPDQPAAVGVVSACRARLAERRARAAVTRARFADPSAAAEVLRQVQILTLTRTLAELDYATPHAAQAAIASLITPAPSPVSGADTTPEPAALRLRTTRADISPNGCPPGPARNGTRVRTQATPDGQPACASPPDRRPASPAGSPALSHYPDSRPADGVPPPLAEAAARIVAHARQQGIQLTQAALARQLRAQGYGIANHRLRWLADLSGLTPRGQHE